MVTTTTSPPVTFEVVELKGVSTTNSPYSLTRDRSDSYFWRCSRGHEGRAVSRYSMAQHLGRRHVDSAGTKKGCNP